MMKMKTKENNNSCNKEEMNEATDPSDIITYSKFSNI